MKRQIFIGLILINPILSLTNAQIYTPNGVIQGVSGNDFIGVGIPNPGYKLTIQGGHTDSRLLLHSTGGGDNARQADLMLWASEPGWTWDGAGIGNNVVNNYYNGSAINRINIARGGSYIRLLNNSMSFNLVSPSGSDRQIISLNEDGKLDINGNLRLRDSSVPALDIGFGSNGDPVRFLSIDVVNSVLPEDPLELVYSRGIGVKIGKDNTDNKYLKVFGLIEAKEIRVLSNINSDFVFENNYELRPLIDVENFILKNKHLPDVPSAGEFKEKGQNLAVVDDILLRKIEELTLYTIEQNKKIMKVLKEKVEKLEAISK